MILVHPVRNRTERDFALQIRFEVFVDEQNCPDYEEVDHYDADALHLIAYDGRTPIGTARLIDKGDGVVKIGRVAVRAPWRGRGAGRAIMVEAMDRARENGFRSAVLDAQVYAIPFYEKLGFVAEGPEFDDAGIPHRHMTRPVQEPGGAIE